MNLNKYQTPLTEELLSTLTLEEKDALLSYLTNVPFITNLVSADRKYARDLPRSEDGRIIIDLANPHILEDMDYFRPSAITYQKTGQFTHLRPNGNPKSEFGKWFGEEIRRFWEGYTRESDGEWIPGELYFYLNYTPIALSKIKEGTKQADRVTDFPESWEATYIWAHYIEQARKGGLHDDFQGGKDAGIIARRGIGKSFYLASNLAKLFTVGISHDVKEELRGLMLAYEKEYLLKDGTLNKFLSMIDFLAENTQFPSSRIKSSITDMQWIMGYMDADSSVAKGTKNEILGLSVKDDPEKVRGKRSHKMFFEEFGVFPKFIDTWTTSEYNVREGEYSFGQRLFVGTGGTKGSDFEGASEIIFHPEGYNVYGLPNLFDKNSQGKSKTILFLGAYLNRKGFYNKDGVSDVIGAIVSVLKERTTLKYNSSDPVQITKKIAEMPITLQESIMRMDSTIYPVADLTEVIERIENNPSHYDSMWIGRLAISDGNVVYKPDTDALYIKDFPHKNNKLEGAICIRQMPVKNSDNNIPWGRYIAGIDPYDDDMSTTSSLGSLYILDLWTDELVFEYTGRPMFADDFYENCRLALLMYNAECNYENNKKGLFTYFSRYNALYLLSDTLQFLRDKEMVKGELYGNKIKGVNVTEGIHKYARLCIRNWLLKPIEQVIGREIDGKIVEETITIKQLSRIPFKPLLRELALWNPEGNFDRHSALEMLMLLREEKLRIHGADSPSDKYNELDKDYLGNDDFFSKNFHNVKNK